MKVDTHTTEVQGGHPLEQIFGVTPNSTMRDVTEVVVEDTVEDPSYDATDLEIQGQFNEIYAEAKEAALMLAGEIELVEGKYKARTGEVMATMLNVALSAAQAKAKQKSDKDKMVGIAKKGPDTVNNNLVVASHDEILRLLDEQSDD